MTAATTCRTCGTEPLENARFCHSCGSPISEATRPAEYKQVACNDEVGYREFADCYRKRANDVGYEGHMALAEEMVKAR
jgi:hypothetical protein